MSGRVSPSPAKFTASDVTESSVSPAPSSASAFGLNEREAARGLLLRHRQFLRSINSVENAKQLPALLMVATGEDLNVLGKLIL